MAAQPSGVPNRRIVAQVLDEFGDGVLSVADNASGAAHDGLDQPAVEDGQAVVASVDVPFHQDVIGATGREREGGQHRRVVAQVRADALPLVAIGRLDHHRITDPACQLHRLVRRGGPGMDGRRQAELAQYLRGTELVARQPGTQNRGAIGVAALEPAAGASLAIGHHAGHHAAPWHAQRMRRLQEANGVETRQLEWLQRALHGPHIGRQHGLPAQCQLHRCSTQRKAIRLASALAYGSAICSRRGWRRIGIAPDPGGVEHRHLVLALHGTGPEQQARTSASAIVVGMRPDGPVVGLHGACRQCLIQRAAVPAAGGLAHPKSPASPAASCHRPCRAMAPVRRELPGAGKASAGASTGPCRLIVAAKPAGLSALRQAAASCGVTIAGSVRTPNKELHHGLLR